MIAIPPQKVQDPDFDWKTLIELRLLTRLLLSDEDYALFQKELSIQIQTYALVNSKTEVTFYSHGEQKTL